MSKTLHKCQNTVLCHREINVLVKKGLSYHIVSGCELLMYQCLKAQPLDWAILVVSEAVVVLWEEIPGQGCV